MARLYEIIYPKSFLMHSWSLFSLCTVGFSVLCLVHFCFSYITVYLGGLLASGLVILLNSLYLFFSWPFLTSAFSWECSKTYFSSFYNNYDLVFYFVYLLRGCLFLSSFHLFVFLLGHFQLTSAKFLPSFTSMAHLLVMRHKCVFYFICNTLILAFQLTVHKVLITLLCQIVCLLQCLHFTPTVLVQQPWLL